MTRTRSADISEDDYAPESSLLTIEVRRSHAASAGGALALDKVWRDAFDAASGTADEDVLKAGLGQVWAESFVLERPAGGDAFAIRPIGRLPRDIQELLADGENLPALTAQINHMAMVNCHAVKPTSGVVELDDGIDVASITLTLLPLASRDGSVSRYLGTLGH